MNLSNSAWNGVPVGSATAVAGGVTGIKNIRGGAGNDTLIGGGGNILIGGGGNDTLVNNSTNTAATNRALLIGGSDADSLTGSAAGDILIGGTTNSDGSNAALQAILAEWQSTDNYSTRFTTLQAGVGSGGYQLVWGSTVLDDSAPDTLTGGVGYDWYFAQLGSGVADTINGLNTPGHEHVSNVA